ncbi:hypothetical protein [uncultured Roseibium sp.]|uniref:hypothetical protein n=1 Tax=uncultured Roseibium sp. TaxID=1936171 RepID=UPI0032171823
MSARFSPRPRRPDTQLPPFVRRRANRLRNGARVLRVAVSVFLVSFVLASALFTPVFLLEVSRMEVVSGDRLMEISRFADHLQALFLGLLVLAVAIVSLFAGVLLARGACQVTRRLAERELPDVPSRCLLKGGIAEMCGV